MILKKTLYFWAAILILLGVFLPGYTKLQELRDKNRDVEMKIRRLNKENALLLQEIQRIANDPFYQEKITREKMGVVRKNEIPVRVIPEPKD
ncbi:MAG: septum formation initiator family protein [Candidatus Omnitrophica bacterium]|nr:septum formation initiator family protein [Candidatus Omnitrophota bacterium]